MAHLPVLGEDLGGDFGSFYLFVIVVYGCQATILDLKYGTTRVIFASTYTAKQMKTMYSNFV